MTTDDRLHDLLHAAADDVQPSAGDWHDVETRGSQTAPAWYRRPTVLAAAAVIVVVLGVAAFLVAQDEPARTRVTHRPGPTTTVTTSPVTTTTAPIPVAPATFVGTTAQSTQLVLADATTGRTLKVLVDYGPLQPTGGDEVSGTVIYGIALSPDRKYVYFNTGPEPAMGQLHRVSTAGGPDEDLGFGYYPAISPTGDRLAFVLDDELVVRNLATREERRYRTKQGSMAVPAFSADGDRIVFESGVDATSELFVIDAELRGPATPIRDSGPYHSPAARVYDNLLGVLTSGPPSDLVVIELPSGKVRGRMPLDQQLLRMDYDTSGRHQLFVANDGTLYRRSGGALQRVASGFTFADW
jgi:hypothetical protein